MGVQSRLGTKQAAKDEESLPITSSDQERFKDHNVRRDAFRWARFAISGTALVYLLASLTSTASIVDFPWPKPDPVPLPGFIKDGMEQCKIIQTPPPNHKHATAEREYNDRFVKGTKAVWLRNATVWTGESGGEEVLYETDVLMDGGVVRRIGSSEEIGELVKGDGTEVQEVRVNGAWITPGIIDMHSHLAVDSAPHLDGADDTNSLKAPILPWLRSLDGFNTHDQAFNLSIAGGVTTMLVLPGSAGAIGGQAYTFKPRTTVENTPGSMQVDPPFVIDTNGNGTWERTGNWRHIKHACGENPSRVYGNTRLDTAWGFRSAYNEGKLLKEKQERWCESPKTQTEPFPQDLQWEVMADILRGNVKVNIHCYETTDLNSMVRISNEFQFPIAAFHHAHETYLVPDLLKQVWGPVPPAVALFATNARYKRESYRGSEFAPKILADAGIAVNMKSDHPVLDSRYLIYEAAQAHHYGLNFSLAMASVTTTPAKSIGLDHRMGYVRPGYDADLVIWDSFPLSLGATPKQTYIDGIPQITEPHVTEKPAAAQEITKAGEYDAEIAEALLTRGEPDLRPKKQARAVIFEGVNNIFVGGSARVMEAGDRVVVEDGKIACAGSCAVTEGIEFEVVDLKGGSFTPGLISVGSGLGMLEIRGEKSTWDGTPYDPTSPAAEMVEGLLVNGVDGVSFGGRDLLLAHRSGVTTAVSFPITNRLFGGLSFAFTTSAEHPLAPHAIVNSATALHLNFETGKSSTSTKIAFIRRLLLGELDHSNEITRAMGKVAEGDLRLVVEVSKADIIAALIRLKREVAPGMKITLLGAHESWMVAPELADEDIGVIVSPSRSFPVDWDSRRVIPGPPLSNRTLPAYLASNGVKVGLGIAEEWQARNTRNDAAWVYANNPEVFSKQQAIELVSTNLDELLGIQTKTGSVSGVEEASWAAWEGDWFSLEARVRGVRSEGSEIVDLF